VMTKKLKHGRNIGLTIDANIQYHAYAAIKKSVQYHDADSGSAIILAPNGEILAMVNYPADDPNDKSIYNAEHYRNRVLSDKVEPGSIMKPFTMLLALDQGKIKATEDELIDVNKRIGHIKPDGKYKKMTVKKILQKSHNLGTVNVSERLNKEDMYNTWRKLGFGRPLGLIPSIENSGSLRHFDSWGVADKRTLSFGHGPMETNLAQLARAYLVFANQGAVPPLKLLKDSSIFDENTQVFSKKTTNKIAELLDAVVSWKGSGYRARIKGYDVAGKTGTAEMVVDGSYNKKGAKRTFFTGFVPVKKPKYIMAVRLDYPKKCYTYYDKNKRNKCEGSNSAAMAFKDTMENILTTDQSIKLLAQK
ncbi:MAG: penicillin-binding transpeptidase domain-containing protein, partial [Gammaproteobacteria bacterium]|nr:penicillin-binding transpeptidase domain-containing protein [Gammaproteobacteria bacterium]